MTISRWLPHIEYAESCLTPTPQPMEFVIGDRVLGFPSDSFVVGSGPECEVKVPGLAPTHAQVTWEGEGPWMIRDLSGKSSLWVNGVRTLDGPIHDGAHLRLGKVVLIVRTPSESTALTPAFRPRGPQESPPATRSLRATAAGEGLQPGVVIDSRYRVVKKLATGGMGEVFKAEHIELGKQLALKVMKPELSADPEFVARFKKEAVASSRIGQQNIIDISDFGRTEDGRFYFVMEYLDGVTLKQILKDEGPQPAERVLRIGLQIARALAAAHRQEIIHRDLKPDNIMVLQRPEQPDFVKVLDFGVAKVASTRGTGGHTAIGVVVGTPQYMSPEQASGLPVDARSDIYSMGLILYELLAGRPTFDSENPSALVVMQMTEAPPPLEPGPLGGTPKVLEELIFSMLAKRIFERPPSMEEVVKRLEQAQGVAAVPKSSGRTTRAQPVVADPELMGSMIRPIAVTIPPRLAARMPPEGATPLESAPFDELAHEQTELEPPQDEAPTDDEEPRVPSVAVEQLRPSRAPLLVVLALLVLGGVAGLVWLQQREALTPVAVVVPLPRPVEPPRPLPVADAAVAVVAAPAKATFTLDSVPHGAEVTEGDVLLGVTPFKLTRELGALVELHVGLKGYVPQVRKLRFEENTEVTLTLEKEKKKERPAGHPPPRPKPRPGEPGDLKDLPDF